MTNKFNYGNVKEILEEICNKNGLVLNIRHTHYADLYDCEVERYIDFGFHDPVKGTLKAIRIYPKRCTLTLYGFLETIMGFFFEHNLTKNNFDWSYYMKKAFTKADLKNGDVIKRRDGTVQIVCLETGTFICKGHDYDLIAHVGNDLKYSHNNWPSCDIVAVRRPKEPSDCSFDAFNGGYGELVYERSEPEEMTLEEVCKALGKEIKIVKG